MSSPAGPPLWLTLLVFGGSLAVVVVDPPAVPRGLPVLVPLVFLWWYIIKIALRAGF